MARSVNLNFVGRAAVTHLAQQRQMIYDAQCAFDAKLKMRNELIFEGLLFALKKVDNGWQDFINNCDDYPYVIYFSRVEEMEKIFELLCKRIYYVLGQHIGDCECSDAFNVLGLGSPCLHCQDAMRDNDTIPF